MAVCKPCGAGRNKGRRRGMGSRCMGSWLRTCGAGRWPIRGAVSAWHGDLPPFRAARPLAGRCGPRAKQERLNAKNANSTQKDANGPVVGMPFPRQCRRPNGLTRTTPVAPGPFAFFARYLRSLRCIFLAKPRATPARRVSLRWTVYGVLPPTGRVAPTRRPRDGVAGVPMRPAGDQAAGKASMQSGDRRGRLPMGSISMRPPGGPVAGEPRHLGGRSDRAIGRSIVSLC